MPTDLENLKTRRSTVAAELAAMTTAGSQGGAIATSTGEGNNPKHIEFRLSLYKELEALNKQIKDLEDEAAADAGNVGFVESFEVP